MRARTQHKYIEDFHLQGYNALYSVEIQLVFRRGMSIPFSVLKSKPRVKQL
jgi:hypothetical protein